MVDAVYRASEPYKWGPRDEDSSINNYARNDFEGVVADTCSGEYNTHLMEQDHNLVHAPAFQFARNACILSINNKTYYSCLPTVRELELIRSHKEDLDTYDPTLSEYPARSLTSFVCGGARGIWASNEINTTGAWADVANGPAGLWGRDKANASDWGVLPVFCIPASDFTSDISTKKYSLLDRVKDDNNNEIGTISGFFTDANNQEYAVVCLDAQYRLDSGVWSSSLGLVTDLQSRNNLVYSNLWNAKETSTFNTQKILDWCSANGYTSEACSHCRSKSFTIEGVTYYGQLPNPLELIDIAKHYNEIEIKDKTSSTYTDLNFSTPRNIWSSSQISDKNAWYLIAHCPMYYYSKTETNFVCPVLELPL